jgi:hypothetical protein
MHSSLKSFRELLPANSALLGTGGYRPIESRILQGDKTICVTIARQVVVEINGRRRFRTFLAGVAKLRPVAPLLETPSSAYLSEEAAAASAGAHENARRQPSSAKRASAMGVNGDTLSPGQDASVNEDNPDVTLDWAGEVVTFAEITTGGFSTNSLIVKVSLLPHVLPDFGCELTINLCFFSLLLFSRVRSSRL